MNTTIYDMIKEYLERRRQEYISMFIAKIENNEYNSYEMFNEDRINYLALLKVLNEVEQELVTKKIRRD